MKRIRKISRPLAFTLLFGLVYELVFPLRALALTGGPSQPEVQSFEPVGTTDMVDVFSGDFVYNIPLLDVGGYPINLSYHGGVGMEQEASWVGLGWNINPGVVNRTMRGLPDEFNGDAVLKEMNLKPNVTIGINASSILKGQKEFFGVPTGSKGKHDLNLGIYFNNYKGIGYNVGYHYLPLGSDGDLVPSLSANHNSQNPSLDIGADVTYNKYFSAGLSYNAVNGFEQFFIRQQISGKYDKKINTRTPRSLESSWSNGGSLISYHNASYTPVANPNMYASSFNFSYVPGYGKVGKFNGFPIQATYSEFGIRSDYRSHSYPAYGYMNSAAGYETSEGLMDFNREKDNSPNKVLTYLGIPQMTHDIYSVSGQGTGGMFRPHLSSAGNVKDPDHKSFGLPSGGGGFEIGAGPTITGLSHLGFDLTMSFNYQNVSAWKTGNDLHDHTKFQVKNGFGGFENWYFKNEGEKTEVDKDYVYGKLKGDGLIRAKLGNFRKIESNLVMAGSSPSVSTPMKRETRELRNNPVFSLPGSSKNECLNTNIEIRKFVDISGNLGEIYDVIDRVNSHRKGYHTTEITNYNADGTRYVYGIPAYNITQKDVSFAVHDIYSISRREKAKICSQKGLYDYEATDASLGNQKGIDNYYQSQTLPPYAHSYLLTAVLSPEYRDLTNNGPTTDDYGTYTKLNYDRTSTSYKWRVPYTLNKTKNGSSYYGMGAFVEGYMSDYTDDKVTFAYGEKEIWYLHSVETKTHVALFIMSDREDGVGAAGEHGGRGTDKLKKLDRIILLTIEEYRNHLDNLWEAEPVKTIYFEYDYSLCPGIPNNTGAAAYNPSAPSVNINSGGKLTLKKVWFTYGKNEKGALNTYEFTYDNTANFGYDMNAMDGWGNYKKNTCGYTSNKDYPFVNQDKTEADLFSSAWSLSQIKLPSGGKINVRYESDDYAYVQDKKAMQMLKVLGFGESTDFGDALPDMYKGGIQKRTQRFIFFKVDQGVNSTTIKDYFPSTADPLFFKFRVDLDGKGNHEYVNGYFQPTIPVGESSHIGYVTHGGTKVGWIYVQQQEYGGIDIHPATHAAFQLVKLEMPHLIFPETNSFKSMNADMGLISGLTGIVPRAVSIVTGLNLYMLSGNMAKKAALDGSSNIRLYVPSKVKLGGGSRVKEIRFSDEWNAMTGNEETFTTGLRYDYSMEEEGKTISSGVATIEPPSMMDECPLKIPEKTYFERLPLALKTNNIFYYEGPMGESYYPGASVGYRKITVRNMTPNEVYDTDDYTLNRHDAGYSVHEFYTAYEFPVQAERTESDIKKAPMVATSILKLIGADFDYKAMSQGFVIKLNDMHGKLKSKAEYSLLNPDKPINKTTYFYKVHDENAVQKQLNNEVTVLYKDGTINDEETVNDAEKAVIGKNVEVVFDNRENESYGLNAGIQANIDFMPNMVPIPTLFPKFYGIRHHQLRTSSTAKIVTTFGLVDRVVVENESARLETKNVAFDAVTGEVLLTKTQTEFSDYEYNLNYPAYWAYDAMGPASTNTFYTFELTGGTAIGAGSAGDGETIVPAGLYNTLCEGDELLKIQGPEPSATSIFHVWVLSKRKDYGVTHPCSTSTPDYKVVLIDEDGKAIPDGNYQFQVIKSGRKNQLAMSIGNVLSKGSPLHEGDNAFGRKSDFTGKNVISASAVEYADEWPVYDDRPVVTEPASYSASNYNVFAGMVKRVINAGKFFTTFQDMTPYVDQNLREPLYQEYQLLKTSVHTDIGQIVWCPRFDGTKWIIRLYKPASCDWMAGCYGCSSGPYCELTVEKGTGACDFSVISGPSVCLGQFGNPYREWIMPPTAGPEYYLYTGNLETMDIECSFKVTSSCYTSFGSCSYGTNDYMMTTTPGNRVNPYLLNLKGNWKAKNSYQYYDRRNTTTPTAVAEYQRTALAGPYNDNAMNDLGYYKDFIPFWKTDCLDETQFTSIEGNNPFGYNPWVKSSELTMVSPYGEELESKNALSIYSSALFGYNHTLPIAVTQNAKHKETAFNNFEEPYVAEKGNHEYSLKWLFEIEHPNFSGKYPAISNEKAHSGNYSAKILPLSRLSSICEIEPTWSNLAVYPTPFATEYVLQDDHLMAPFGLEPAKKYIISYWVYDPDNTHSLLIKRDASTSLYSNFLGTFQGILNGSYTCNSTMAAGMRADYLGYYEDYDAETYWEKDATPNFTQPTLSVTNEINGWKLVQGEITVPVTSPTIKALRFCLRNSSSTLPVYIDDFRIFPADAAMKSFVYNRNSRRLMATLDENNYASFYEYDEEGNVIRVKRETEKGIITIKENRQNLSK